MQILCLPGYGTNPEVMKRQMSLLLKICDPAWEFHFLEAKIPCRPAPGIPKGAAGPYLCWTEDFGPAENRAAIDLIHHTFATEGPFDGVFGFSQGASMAAAYLLEQATLYPDQPLPVRFGIFASPPPILATDPAYIDSVYGSLSETNLRYVQSASLEDMVHLPDPARSSATLLIETLTFMKPVHGKSLSYFFDRPASEIPWVLLPDFYATRLGIPTLHVLARDDPAPLQSSSEVCRGFCDPGRRRVFKHTALHGLPREPSQVKELAELMRGVIQDGRGSRL
ncbi:serine hydrolase FSH [Aspergillus carlsbadensis]|nr:serine hydrolase FSH [Aspergillus carlsbadensis]